MQRSAGAKGNPILMDRNDADPEMGFFTPFLCQRGVGRLSNNGGMEWGKELPEKERSD